MSDFVRSELEDFYSSKIEMVSRGGGDYNVFPVIPDKPRSVLRPLVYAAFFPDQGSQRPMLFFSSSLEGARLLNRRFRDLTALKVQQIEPVKVVTLESCRVAKLTPEGFNKHTFFRNHWNRQQDPLALLTFGVNAATGDPSAWLHTAACLDQESWLGYMIQRLQRFHPSIYQLPN